MVSHGLLNQSSTVCLTILAYFYIHKITFRKANVPHMIIYNNYMIIFFSNISQSWVLLCPKGLKTDWIHLQGTFLLDLPLRNWTCFPVIGFWGKESILLFVSELHKLTNQPGFSVSRARAAKRKMVQTPADSCLERTQPQEISNGALKHSKEEKDEMSYSGCNHKVLPIINSNMDKLSANNENHQEKWKTKKKKMFVVQI